jgi:tetratricopeptide (TPR) repeat protein
MSEARFSQGGIRKSFSLASLARRLNPVRMERPDQRSLEMVGFQTYLRTSRFRWFLSLPLLLGLLAGNCSGQSFAQQLAELQSKFAADPTNTTLLFKLADLCHDEGGRDNRDAVKLAEKYFHQLLALEPTNALAMALLGSTLTMKGRDALWPNTQIKHVKEGNRTMDAAVKLAPDDPEVRFVRAINNFHMPKFLGREEIVQADFAWLWEQLQVHPKSFSNERKQEFALRYGSLLKKQKKLDAAVKVWQQGHEVDSQSPLATQIREQLRKATSHDHAR